MKIRMLPLFAAGVLVSSMLLTTGDAWARPGVRGRDGAAVNEPSQEGNSDKGAVDEDMGKGLTAQDRSILRLAQQGAAQIGKTMEKWVNEKKITKAKLFSFLYYPIAGTDPPKFHTDYDKYSDIDFVPIQEKLLAADSSIVFVVTVDQNGYLPTHDRKYSKPLTGHHSIDLVSNRTKRIFNDRTGIRAARNTQPFLLQSYKRDTGEVMKDLSVPIYVFGEHWGGLRFGYKSRD